MKKLLDKYSWSRILLGILVVALGVTLIIVSACNNASEMTKIICIIFGVYVSVLAALTLLVAFVVEGKNKSVFPGTAVIAVSLAIGLVFCIFSGEYAGVLETVVRTLVPMILICLGGAFVIQSIVEIASKMESKNWITRLVLGVLFTTLGIILICTGSAVKWIYIILGVLLIVLGILWLVFGIIYAKNKRAVFKAAKAREEAANK